MMVSFTQTLRAVAGIAVAAGLCVCLPAVGRAQSRDPATAPSSSPHRFFDRLNLAWTGVETGALLADGYYTQVGLTRYPEISREADPLARPFVSRGWPGQIAGGALVVTADVGLRYWLHRRSHHRIERFVPLILTVYGAAGAIHNARELRRVERILR